jgi:hypothetical protein
MLLKNAPADKARSGARRELPRIELLGSVQGRVEPGNVAVKVLDIGVSGFGIESPQRFEHGSTHNFRLTLADGTSTVLAGIVVHSEKRFTADGSDLYLTGLRFAEQSGQKDAAGKFIDRILSVMSFDIP